MNTDVDRVCSNILSLFFCCRYSIQKRICWYFPDNVLPSSCALELYLLCLRAPTLRGLTADITKDFTRYPYSFELFSEPQTSSFLGRTGFVKECLNQRMSYFPDKRDVFLCVCHHKDCKKNTGTIKSFSG